FTHRLNYLNANAAYGALAHNASGAITWMQSLHGELDAPKVYSRVLSAAELQADLVDPFTAVRGGGPTVTGISPSSGSGDGGTTVTITGTNLAGATTVNFGTTAAASISSSTTTQVVAVTPAHAVGTVDITVVTLGGTSTTVPADQFTFSAP